MHQSTASKPARKAAQKPPKPHENWPLFAHATRRWAKKVLGKMHYFGPWENPQAALEKWLAVKDDLLAGREPRQAREGLTVAHLCNSFLTSKQARVHSGELSERSFSDYHKTCERVVAKFGKGRLVEDLRPSDFEALRNVWASSWSPVTIGNEVQRVRVLMRYAHDEGLVAEPIKMGKAFCKPSAKLLRIHKAAQVRKNGERTFSAEQLRMIIAAAPPILKSMILLSINGGFGQTDLANMPRSVVDLERGWVNFERVKTGVPRRCKLWPETIAALRVALDMRPKAKDPADDSLCFLTRTSRRWVKQLKSGHDDSIGKEFAKLLSRLGIKRPGLNYYGLRHCFATVANASLDRSAVDVIMGHADHSVSARYVEHVDDARIERVCQFVHDWLFGKPEPKATRLTRKEIRAIGLKRVAKGVEAVSELIIGKLTAGEWHLVADLKLEFSSKVPPEIGFQAWRQHSKARCDDSTAAVFGAMLLVDRAIETLVKSGAIECNDTACRLATSGA